MKALWNISIQKKYATKNHAFSLDVKIQSNARRLVLFGVSGSGKTQTLRMLSGLSTPDNGAIEFDGEILFSREQSVNLSPQRRLLTYVFQEYALFPHLNVLQNIVFSENKGLVNSRNKVPSPECEKWLDKFGLSNLAYQFPHQLSGGQSQRVALARALVSKPKALLLDEPFSALDEGLRRTLRNELKELQEQLAIPVILISHSLEDVENFGEEVIQLQNGQVLAKEIL
jgi:molybdate transport system ATP-binding protein